ncbi:hypothetical protein [Archangium violaceum]|uniref:hypothetical protein n=1 Tax=Archangium violaceum TaxID=83451 RepID=UPI0031B89AE5
MRLLDRTTRRVSLTQEGAIYYERCVRILALRLARVPSQAWRPPRSRAARGA